MNYFKHFWNDDRGDEYSSWGTSTWYFETNDCHDILKQIEIYQNDKVLKYSEDCLEDEFGMLGDQKLTAEECSGTKISKEEFYKIWNNKQAFNIKEQK